jgi:hypothetical protein
MSRQPYSRFSLTQGGRRLNQPATSVVPGWEHIDELLVDDVTDRHDIVVGISRNALTVGL